MDIANSVRYIEFTDTSGQKHRYAVDIRQRIGTVRADGSNETDIFYADDSFGAQANRPDGTSKVFIQYENGMLEQIIAHKSDGTEEARLSFRDGNLDSAVTNREDESVEAIVSYNRGQLHSVSSVKADSSIETVMQFEHGELKSVEVPSKFEIIDEE